MEDETYTIVDILEGWVFPVDAVMKEQKIKTPEQIEVFRQANEKLGWILMKGGEVWKL